MQYGLQSEPIHRHINDQQYYPVYLSKAKEDTKSFHLVISGDVRRSIEDLARSSSNTVNICVPTSYIGDWINIESE
jgi:hypothetical protein